MLIDMHAHTRGISKCCKATSLDAVLAAKSQGIDGLILTNHYQEKYVENGDASAFAERFVNEYKETRALAETHGLRLFYGIEVTMKLHGNVHMLVYGVDEDFVFRYPALYEYTQEELYRIAHENGGVLVQAHGMRNGKNVLLDLSYMDGLEINSHPLYDSTHYEELSALAKENGLFLTSGGDYHMDTHRVRCGMVLPDTLSSTAEIVAYLQSTDVTTVCLQEPDATECEYREFSRKE